MWKDTFIPPKTSSLGEFSILEISLTLLIYITGSLRKLLTYEYIYFFIPFDFFKLIDNYFLICKILYNLYLLSK